MRASDSPNPLTPFLEAQGVVLLDGGLATELEAQGEVLDDQLWSAKVLQGNPEVIRQVHLDYLRAGADCLVSASYQATFEGFARQGLTEEQTADLLRLSVALAIEARNLFWDENQDPSRRWPLVAASVGPYGAYMADGSEYTGDYPLDRRGLSEFHGPRLEVLAASGADLLACETIPSIEEAGALCDLLDSTEGIPAWVTFSCRDGKHLSDGSLFAEAIALASECSRVVAVGINCTPPEFVSELLSTIGRVRKPLVVYPNSGEGWDAVAKRWTSGVPGGDPVDLCGDWRSLGAGVIGGCCRIGPADIAAMRARLLAPPASAG
jgi:homocysteine S-methyltransferase